MIPPSRPPRRARPALLPPPARSPAPSLGEQETRPYRRVELPTPVRVPEGPNGTHRMARRAFDSGDVAEAERAWWDRAQRMARRRSIRPGDLIGGRFRVVRAQREGDTLAITARHEGFDRQVRLRVLLRDHAAGAREQLLREARALARFESDHVARIVDAGVLHDDGIDGAIFLAREYVAGEPLVELSQEEPSLELALTWFSQIGEAVQEAHSHGIVLRDLRLSQIVVATRSCGERAAKLLELGRSTGLPDDHGDDTALRIVGPTVAPELVRGEPGDTRSDVWSLGCALYQLLSGEPAFAGAGTRLMAAIQNDEPEPLRRWRRDAPAALDALIRRALHKDPARRPAGVRALVEAAWSAAGIAPPPAAQRALERIARLAGPEAGGGAEVAEVDVPNADVEAVGADARVEELGAEPARSPWAAARETEARVPEPSYDEIPCFTDLSDDSLDDIGRSGDDVILTDSAQMWMHALSIRPPRARSRRAVLLGAAIACLPGMLLFAAALDGQDRLRAAAVLGDAGAGARAWAAQVAAPAPEPVDDGTLVVMASGGSCRVDVDGEPKGKGIYLTVPVRVGTHSVGCVGADGIRRTRSVTVTREQAGVTVFRF